MSRPSHQTVFVSRLRATFVKIVPFLVEPELKSEKAPTDSDGDGMPDEWEKANGLNPEDAADGKQTNADGYTNLEFYMNSLVADITERQNEGGINMSGQETAIKQAKITTSPNNRIYNLNGMQVNNPRRGIYIYNNKKYIKL